MKPEPDLNLVKIAQKFSTPEKARKWFEKQRWPDGPLCPHCKSKEVKRIEQRKNSKSPGRAGLFRCRGCNGQFTVTKGTIFEDSHIGLDKWMMAMFVVCGAKKGISAHQLHRMLGVTYKTAWFMAHRIRYVLDNASQSAPMTGVVEVDEAYVGGKPRPANTEPVGTRSRGRKYGAASSKTPVVALVQRTGEVRTKVIVNVTAKNLANFLDAQICKSATVCTDQFALYKNLFYDWKRHEMVNHSRKEYARTEADGFVAHSNTVESFFSLIKRGVYGSFHHVSREHLFRYCGEFAFRWNNRKLTDGEWMEKAFEMTEGKRLTYRQTV